MTNNAAIIEQPNSRTAERYNYPLVSIIIPAYNAAQYIHRAIESSLRQTHKNLDILIIDDGSTDDTLKVAQTYAADDERVRVFTQKHAEVSAARNHGIREAKGQYITFIDSDDWLEDNAVEILLSAQLQYPDKFIAANFYLVSEDFTKSVLAPKFKQPVFCNMHDIAESYCRMSKKPAVFHNIAGKFFSTKILAQGVYFPEGISYSEDAVLEIKYLYKGSGAVIVNQPVYNVWERQGSMTRSAYTPEVLQAQIDAYDILINLSENSPEIKKLLRLSRVIYISDIIDAGLHNPEYGISREEILRIRELLKDDAKEFIHDTRTPFKRKVKFVIDVYLPLWLGRYAVALMKCVKRLIGR